MKLLIAVLLCFTFLMKPTLSQAQVLSDCTSVPSGDCNQASGARRYSCQTGTGHYCCTNQAACGAQQEANLEDIGGDDPGLGIDGITNAQFNAFNPLLIMESPFSQDLSTPGGIISRFLLFAFPIAGLIIFVMVFWGGFEILAGSATKKSIDAGKQRITAAVVGFVLLFVSYWLIRLLEEVLGLKVF